MAVAASSPVDLCSLPDGLRSLAARGTLRRYARGTLIIEEGSHGDTLYLLLGGSVRAYSGDARGREVTFGVYRAGDYFGEMSLDGGPRSANVVAEQTCVCAVVTRKSLLEHVAAEPAFALELLCRVIWRARLATQSARNMALLDVYGRVVQLLDSLATPSADGSRVIAGRLTHGDIAARVGCSREMVSRLLKDLESGGHYRRLPTGIVLSAKLPARW